MFCQVICNGTNGFQSGFRVKVGCFVTNELDLAFFQSNRFVECVGFFGICFIQNVRVKYNWRIRRNIYNTDRWEGICRVGIVRYGNIVV